MSDAASHGSHVSDLNVSNMRSALGQERALAADEGGGLDGVMGGHRSYGEGAVGFGDGVEALDAGKIDDAFRGGQAEFHQGNQAHASGEEFGVGRVEEGEGFG